MKEKIQKIKDKIEKLNIQLEKLKEKCNHEETYEKSYYNSGSYSDHAYTTYYTYCSICGKIVNELTKEHPWFG